MALIKRSKIIEKGFVDIGQASPNISFASPLQEEASTASQAAYVEQDISPSSDDSASSDEERLESAYEKASKIIEQAQSESQEIMENAQSEVEELRQNAKVEG